MCPRFAFTRQLKSRAAEAATFRVRISTKAPQEGPTSRSTLSLVHPCDLPPGFLIPTMSGPVFKCRYRSAAPAAGCRRHRHRRKRLPSAVLFQEGREANRDGTVFPAVTDLPQLLVSEKSPASAPVMPRLVMWYGYGAFVG